MNQKKLVVACFAVAVISFNANAQEKKAPPPPPKEPSEVVVNGKKEYDDFLKRNPSIKNLFWKGTGRIIGVKLKSGKEEVYNLENKDELAAIVAKYGSIPEPPPPPPPVPKKPSKEMIPEVPGVPEIPGVPSEPSGEIAPPAEPGKPGAMLPPKKDDDLK